MILKYKIARIIIKYKKYFIDKNRDRIISKMNKQQLDVFNTIKNIVINNRSSIRFDPLSHEILIVLSDMLITIKSNMIYIDNTTGFLSVEYDIRAHKLLTDFIHSEVHRERRKLKHEVKQRIQDFIKKISEETN